MDSIFGKAIGVGSAVVCVFIGIKLLWSARSRVYKYLADNKIVQHNVIPIINKDKADIFSIVSVDGDVNKYMIDSSTLVNFVNTYNVLNKNKDIYIIMHTHGGSLSSAEAISNCILNHKGPGEIICVIPYYAYSAGFCIALACNKIIMVKNAIVGPCDAQQPAGNLKYHSVASISYAVEHKINKGEKVSEEWLASSYDATLCKERQKRYINLLVSNNRYSEETGKKVYEEFFSGKYNHDQVFTPLDLINVGIKVEIVDEIPLFVNDFLQTQ